MEITLNLDDDLLKRIRTFWDGVTEPEEIKDEIMDIIEFVLHDCADSDYI